jgi:bifunctional UDP-N-acetylglucosamine pyrophosphorylase/glucosamine-1-phosphate N-acetyltransferase
MQAVIMAAGRGSRMKDLTDSTPKSMLKVNGKPLLEYKLDALPEEVDEVVIVVNYLADVIKKHFGDSYGGRKIHYVEQESPTAGTADAIWKAKPYITGKFFAMNGDNIYAPEDMQKCLMHEWAVLVMKGVPVRTGAVVTDERDRITSIAENTEHEGGVGYANTGFYLLDEHFFDYPAIPKAPGSTELGLPQTMMQAAKDIVIRAVSATYWIEIKAPEDLEKAERVLKGVKGHKEENRGGKRA